MNTEIIFILSIVVLGLGINLWVKRNFLKQQLMILWNVCQAQAEVYNGKRIRYRIPKKNNR